MRFRRPIRRPRLARRLLRNVLPDEYQNELRQAHHLMETGDYQQASTLFWRLAEIAEKRNLPGRAPFLFIQAGRAFSLSGNSKMAKSGLIHGFELLVASNRWRALNDISNRVLQELNNSNKPELAAAIEAWIKENVPENVNLTPPQSVPSTSTRPGLPAKCPYCGASVSPVDVDWLDETSAACNYCGSVITS
jgi:hypothetical protein